MVFDGPQTFEQFKGNLGVVTAGGGALDTEVNQRRGAFSAEMGSVIGVGDR